MNGGEAVVRTLAGGGVDVCFMNPGTSEMQFVAALERVPELRAVLTLFEGVATGAADGYARMAGKPAATLLHLGPGLANGLANLHNANRAQVPIVNIVGDHATYHRHYESPLASDVAGYARQASSWIRTASHARTAGSDTAAAISASREGSGRIATLIVPADCAWTEGAFPEPVSPPTPPAKVDEATIAAVAEALASAEPAMLLVAGAASSERGLLTAGRIAARTGARLAIPTFVARIPRGAGAVAVERVPYRADHAVRFLERVRHLVLVGAAAPVSFFAYPGKASWLTPADVRMTMLARPEHDAVDALERLADRLDATSNAPVQEPRRPELPTGKLTPASALQAVAALLPEGCIVVDEAVSYFAQAWSATEGAARHDLLMVTGGAIGDGMPLSVGAAVACPGRRVVTLQSDGSAAYTLQALWTQAREGLDVTTILLANRAYGILKAEYRLMHGGADAGPLVEHALSLTPPDLDWVALARGMGVPASRPDTAEGFATSMRAALASAGPSLIEVVL